MMRTLAVVSLLHIFDQAAAGKTKPEPLTNTEKDDGNAVTRTAGTTDGDKAERSFTDPKAPVKNKYKQRKRTRAPEARTTRPSLPTLFSEAPSHPDALDSRPVKLPGQAEDEPAKVEKMVTMQFPDPPKPDVGSGAFGEGRPLPLPTDGGGAKTKTKTKTSLRAEVAMDVGTEPPPEGSDTVLQVKPIVVQRIPRVAGPKVQTVEIIKPKPCKRGPLDCLQSLPTRTVEIIKPKP